MSPARRRLLALAALALSGCAAQLVPLGPLTADRARLGAPGSSSVAAAPMPSTPPSSLPPRSAQPPKIREAHLRNGVRVLMLEEHYFPLAGVGFVLARGDADADKPGMMDLFFRTLTSGSDLVSAKGLDTDLYALGAQRNVRVHMSYCALDLTAVAPVMDDVMRIEASTFVSPIFDGTEFDEILDHQQTAVRGARGFPAVAAKRALMKLLYPPEHPNARDAADTDKPLDGVKVESVRAMRPLVGPDDVAVVVAGHFDPDAFLGDLDKALGGLGGHAFAPRTIPDVAPATEAHVVLLDHPGDVQVQMALGFVTVKYDDPDYAALSLASRLLGRASWGSMRLSHGLTYGASASMAMSRVQAPFTLTVAVEPSRVIQALRDALGTLDLLRNFDKQSDELALGKQVVDASWPDAFDTIEESLGTLESIAGLGLPADGMTALRTAVQGVTAADLKRVAEKYLDPAHMQLVLLGDVGRFRGDVTALGLGTIEERKAPH